MYKFLIILVLNLCLNAAILQKTIDRAPIGATLKLSPGLYKEKIIISKPIKLIGSNNVTIKGDGKGTVIKINSSNVTLQNIKIQNSGERLETLDAAIKISNAKNITINNCTIKNTLFGIDMDRVNNSIISNNEISSKNLPISLRGDAIKLYYSHNNTIKNNRIFNSRDVTLSYSNNNIITLNHTETSRFALHFMKTKNNIIDNNHFRLNSTALILTGTQNTKIENNQIQSSTGAAGIGVLVKGVSNFQFRKNIVSFNAKGFYIDAKHNETQIKRFIQNNEISYNKEALHFHGAIKQNLIKNNTFIGNIDDVIKSVRGNFSSNNIVENNYWDKYSGFDKDKNNIGDSSYKIFQYADQLWHYNHRVKFFYAAPIMSILNFIVNLAPFVEPVLLLEDKKPIIKL